VSQSRRASRDGGLSRGNLRKPFAVQHFTLTTTLVVVWIPWGALLVLYGGYRSVPHILAGLAVGFWLPALAFAFVPLNPYNFWMDRPDPSRRAKTAQLDEEQRRVLVAFYDPGNRRRAFFCALTASLIFAGLWLLSLIWVERSDSPVWRLDYLLLAFLAMATPSTAWVGYAGLGTRIRSNWREITSRGRAWPKDVEYPGPLKDRVVSFLTGRMPYFSGSKRY